MPALQQLLAQIPAEERALSGRVLMAGAASMPVMVGLTFLAPCVAPTLSALAFGLFALRAYRK
ncbi:hypothetical protein DFI_19720 (plasmid) [Deinococcus ficus]|uniref:Uncharacterized protein n=1 Tax=Deinococcus ficus TaxID=317577 RepID=A0A221T3G6_9DEIO|nr:hypothetical protein DFI_19720 [Deinococcus ficus]